MNDEELVDVKKESKDQFNTNALLPDDEIIENNDGDENNSNSLRKCIKYNFYLVKPFKILFRFIRDLDRSSHKMFN